MSSAKEVLCLKIELSEGRREMLRIYEEDEPEEAARLFCERFHLDRKFEEGLSNLIEYHIDNVLETQALYSLDRTDIQLNTPPKTQNSSDLPLSSDQNKLDLYYALFEELSDPLTYKISYESVSSQNLTKSLQRILEPIIDELKESAECIGFSEFTRAMDLLLPTLTARDRILLLSNYLEGRPRQVNTKKEELRREIENLKALKSSRMKKEEPRKFKSLNFKYC